MTPGVSTNAAPVVKEIALTPVTTLTAPTKTAFPAARTSRSGPRRDLRPRCAIRAICASWPARPGRPTASQLLSSLPALFAVGILFLPALTDGGLPRRKFAFFAKCVWIAVDVACPTGVTPQDRDDERGRGQNDGQAVLHGSSCGWTAPALGDHSDRSGRSGRSQDRSNHLGSRPRAHVRPGAVTPSYGPTRPSRSGPYSSAAYSSAFGANSSNARAPPMSWLPTLARANSLDYIECVHRPRLFLFPEPDSQPHLLGSIRSRGDLDLVAFLLFRLSSNEHRGPARIDIPRAFPARRTPPPFSAHTPPEPL